MSYGLLPTGFTPKTLENVVDEMHADARAELGENVELDEREPLGQLLGVVADQVALLWETAEEVYSAQTSQAVGTPLDDVAAITGTQRLEATKSTVTLLCTGTPATVLPIGRVVRTSDTGARFVTTAAAVISGYGTVSVAAESEEEGPVAAAAGTLTVIDTAESGWTSVTNTLDAEPGRLEETDAALQARRVEELRGVDAAAIDSIRNRVREVEGVTACSVFENTTQVTDGSGLPPKSFMVVVQGGDDQDLRDAILEVKPAGIETYGSTSGTATDGEGQVRTIKFSRPVDVNVYLVVNLQKLSDDYPADGDDLVKAALAAYGDESLTLGRDVISSAMVPTVFTIPGVIDVTELYLGTAPAPASEATLVITDRTQVARLDTSRITVVSTNGSI